MKLLIVPFLFFLTQNADNHSKLWKNAITNAFIMHRIHCDGIYIRAIALLEKGDTLNGSVQIENGWDEGDFSKSMLCRRVRIEDDRSGKSKIYGPDKIKWFKIYLGNGRVETFYSSVRNGFIPVKQRETDGLWNLGYGVFLHYITGQKLKEFKEYYWNYNPRIFVSAYQASIYFVKNDKELLAFTHRRLTKKDETEWEGKMLNFISDCPSLADSFKKFPDGVLSAQDFVNGYDSCDRVK